MGKTKCIAGYMKVANRLRPEPIRFVKLDSEHAQSDGKSVNRGLPVLDLARGTQRSNECACLSRARAWEWIAPISFPEAAILLVSDGQRMSKGTPGDEVGIAPFP